MGSNSNQENIDFLVAFKQNDVYHLILIEAKAESGWTNKQLSSKAEKHKEIFGETSCMWKSIKPHLLLTSPRMPLGLRLDVLPNYLLKPIKEMWFE